MELGENKIINMADRKSKAATRRKEIDPDIEREKESSEKVIDMEKTGGMIRLRKEKERIEKLANEVVFQFKNQMEPDEDFNEKVERLGEMMSDFLADSRLLAIDLNDEHNDLIWKHHDLMEQEGQDKADEAYKKKIQRRGAEWEEAREYEEEVLELMTEIKAILAEKNNNL